MTDESRGTERLDGEPDTERPEKRQPDPNQRPKPTSPDPNRPQWNVLSEEKESRERQDA